MVNVRSWGRRLLGWKHRKDAIIRTWALIWAWLASTIILTIMLVAFLVAIVDVIIQFAFNHPGILPTGWYPTQLAVILNWFTDLHIYAFTGQGGFAWLPEYVAM